MKTTTDLAEIREYPSRFTCGDVTKIHDIGPYTLVEYTRPCDDVCRFHKSFYIYVDGESTSASQGTLEGALLIAISRKNLEPNLARYMAIGAAKLLGVSNS